MPTEQISRYFQVASSDRWCRWKKISGALASVVASTATHSMPRCWLTVTSVMVARKRSRQPVSAASGPLANSVPSSKSARGACDLAGQVADGVDRGDGEQHAGDGEEEQPGGVEGEPAAPGGRRRLPPRPRHHAEMRDADGDEERAARAVAPEQQRRETGQRRHQDERRDHDASSRRLVRRSASMWSNSRLIW